MKGITRIIRHITECTAAMAVILTLSATLSSCAADRIEEGNQAETDGLTVRIEASQIKTRSLFTDKADNEYPAVWTEARSAQFSLDGAALVSAAPQITDGGRQATFDVRFTTNAAASGTIRAFSPKGGGFTTIGSSYVSMVIPSTQKPTDKSCDEAIHALYGSTGYNGSIPETISMTFHHAAAYGRMTIDNFEGGDFESVSITFPKALVGDNCKFWYEASGSNQAGTITGADVKTITIDTENLSSNVFWFGCAPCEEMTSGSLIIKAVGSDGREYSKTVTLSPSRKLAFRQGRISSFTVDMDGVKGTEKWSLVTDASTLEPGDVLVLACSQKGKTAGSLSSNYLTSVSSVFSSDASEITSLGEGTIQFTLTGSEGAWKLIDPDRAKLGSTGQGKTTLGSSSATNTWKISTSNGLATVQSTRSTGERFLYNVSSPRFNTYTTSASSSMLLPQLYRRNTRNNPEDYDTDMPVIVTKVTTGSASAITTSTATLNGSFTNASASPREAGFEWGLTSSLGQVQQCDLAPAGTSGSFSAGIDNLTAGRTYYYRAYIIVSENGTNNYYYGAVRTLTVADDGTSASIYPTWYELPVMNVSKSGSYLVNSQDNSQYYAYHLCAGTEKGPTGAKARNYTVCYSADHHCPLWIAAPRHSMYTGKANRTDAYGKDGDIPSSIQYSSKSTGGGCNKGHMLGSAERTSSSATNRQVFYYTNIAPQLSSGFNTGGGGWNTLEDWVDKQVCADTLYEVIGCHFERFTDGYGYTVEPKTIAFGGRTDVDMPTMFYYVLLRTKNGSSKKAVRDCSASELKCAAFVRAHTNSLKEQAVTSREMMSVSDLERITGVTYFPNVPNAPKSTFNASDWGL